MVDVDCGMKGTRLLDVLLVQVMGMRLTRQLGYTFGE